MKFFTDENSLLAEEIIGRYPKPRSAMIPLLHLAQEQEGWVTDEAMAEIAELVGTTSAEVLGTCSFYEMFKRHPVGKYVINILQREGVLGGICTYAYTCHFRVVLTGYLITIVGQTS